jgi:UDP-N-acetyl-D-glucosamine dehydrogenase
LGVAFKHDIDDARNSPAERIIEILLGRGAEVAYHDPHVPSFHAGGDVFYRERVVLESVELTEEALAAADCIVIVTEHTSVDYERVAQYGQLIVDTRNAIADASGYGQKIVRLGAPLPQ